MAKGRTNVGGGDYSIGDTINYKSLGLGSKPIENSGMLVAGQTTLSLTFDATHVYVTTYDECIVKLNKSDLSVVYVIDHSGSVSAGGIKIVEYGDYLYWFVSQKIHKARKSDGVLVDSVAVIGTSGSLVVFGGYLYSLQRGYHLFKINPADMSVVYQQSDLTYNYTGGMTVLNSTHLFGIVQNDEYNLYWLLKFETATGNFVSKSTVNVEYGNMSNDGTNIFGGNASLTKKYSSIDCSVLTSVADGGALEFKNNKLYITPHKRYDANLNLIDTCPSNTHYTSTFYLVDTDDSVYFTTPTAGANFTVLKANANLTITN